LVFVSFGAAYFGLVNHVAQQDQCMAYLLDILPSSGNHLVLTPLPMPEPFHWRSMSSQGTIICSLLKCPSTYLFTRSNTAQRSLLGLFLAYALRDILSKQISIFTFSTAD
jgi:hypothetical protein